MSGVNLTSLIIVRKSHLFVLDNELLYSVMKFFNLIKNQQLQIIAAD